MAIEFRGFFVAGTPSRGPHPFCRRSSGQAHDAPHKSISPEDPMKKLLFAALAAGAMLSTVGVATAQVYLDFGRPDYRERYYDDGPRYRGRACPRGTSWIRGYGCVPNCPRGFTWQSGACKPYRGY